MRAEPAPPLSAIAPMLSEEAKQPFDDPAWLFEINFDGCRLLAETSREDVRLASRNGGDVTHWFPELQELKALGGRHVLDGEACVLDDMGRPDFMRLQARAARRGFPAGAEPIVYCVFDLLVHNGRNLMARPLWARQALLAKLLASPPLSILLVTHVVEQGRWLYQEAQALQLEGIVAKRIDSIYRPGERTKDWLINRPGAVPAKRFKR